MGLVVQLCRCNVSEYTTDMSSRDRYSSYGTSPRCGEAKSKGMIAVTVDGGSIYPSLAALVNVRFAGLLEKMRASMSMSIDASSALICWPPPSAEVGRPP